MEVLEIVKNLDAAGEFSGLSDATLEWWIEFCKPFVSKKKFGKFYERALGLVTLHFMTISGIGSSDSGGAGGELGALGATAKRSNITSISEGGSSISFSAEAGGMSGAASVIDEYSQTEYGMQYLALLRMVIVPITIDGV